MRKLLTLAVLCFCVAGCGSTSSARIGDLQAFKRNHTQDVGRALEGKLTAPEVRSSLESIDKAILAETAHDKDADLEGLRLKLLDESDKATADLFDGDNGR